MTCENSACGYHLNRFTERDRFDDSRAHEVLQKPKSSSMYHGDNRSVTCAFRSSGGHWPTNISKPCQLALVVSALAFHRGGEAFVPQTCGQTAHHAAKEAAGGWGQGLSSSTNWVTESRASVGETSPPSKTLLLSSGHWELLCT